MSRTRILAASLLTSGLMAVVLSCSGDPAAAPVDDGGTPVPDAIVRDVTWVDVDFAACIAGGMLGEPRPNCPNDAPPDDDCATASPGYDDVAPIFGSHCAVCHRAGGLETTNRFDTYALVHDDQAKRDRIFARVLTCVMPPPCAPDLSPDERRTMLKWFTCGAPERRAGG